MVLVNKVPRQYFLIVSGSFPPEEHVYYGYWWRTRLGWATTPTHLIPAPGRQQSDASKEADMLRWSAG